MSGVFKNNEKKIIYDLYSHILYEMSRKEKITQSLETGNVISVMLSKSVSFQTSRLSSHVYRYAKKNIIFIHRLFYCRRMFFLFLILFTISSQTVVMSSWSFSFC